MRGLLLDLTPLRGREFRLLFLAQLVSFFGSMITFVALPFQMYDLTESTLAVGALGVCQFVPIVTVALVSGALADAVDRRTLVRLAELGSAVVVGGLLANSLLGEPQVWVLFVCAALLAAFYALLRPPLHALVPRVVPREQLKAAMALEWLRSDVGMIAGPALGGVLIAAFGVHAHLRHRHRHLPRLARLPRAHAGEPAAGRRRPAEPALDRRRAALRVAAARCCSAPTWSTSTRCSSACPRRSSPPSRRAFGGAEALGLLLAAPAVGSLLVALFSGWTRHVHRHGRAVALAACGWGLAIIAFGLADALWLALVCLAVAGGMDAISGLFRSVIWNETIPDRLRGRLGGVEMISYTSGPTLGNFEAGALASVVGVRASVVSGGVMCLVGTGVILAFLPALWRYDARREDRA